MNNWTKPIELTQPGPRIVTMSGNLKTALYLITALMVPMILFALLLGGTEYYKIEHLKNHGISTTGTIISLHAPANPNAKGAIWRVDFTYTPQTILDGSTAQAHNGVSPTDFSLLEIGQQVPIVYDPTVANNVEINLHDRVHTEQAWLFLLVLAPFPMLFLILLAVILPKYLKQKSLLQNGEAAQATILSETDIPYGRGRCTMVAYRFTDSNGMTIEGKQKGLPSKAEIEKRDNFHKYYNDIMTNPTVVFDPRNSNKNMLYPLGFVTCKADT